MFRQNTSTFSLVRLIFIIPIEAPKIFSPLLVISRGSGEKMEQWSSEKRGHCGASQKDGHCCSSRPLMGRSIIKYLYTPPLVLPGTWVLPCAPYQLSKGYPGVLSEVGGGTYCALAIVPRTPRLPPLLPIHTNDELLSHSVNKII